MQLVAKLPEGVEVGLEGAEGGGVGERDQQLCARDGYGLDGARNVSNGGKGNAKGGGRWVRGTEDGRILFKGDEEAGGPREPSIVEYARRGFDADSAGADNFPLEGDGDGGDGRYRSQSDGAGGRPT